MSETTINEEGPLGSIPRGGSTEKVEESQGCPTTTEQCSVEIANRPGDGGDGEGGVVGTTAEKGGGKGKGKKGRKSRLPQLGACVEARIGGAWLRGRVTALEVNLDGKKLATVRCESGGVVALFEGELWVKVKHEKAPPPDLDRPLDDEQKAALAEIPDSPTCSRCGHVAGWVDAAGLCPVCVSSISISSSTPAPVLSDRRPVVGDTVDVLVADSLGRHAAEVVEARESEFAVRFDDLPAQLWVQFEGFGVCWWWPDVEKCARKGCDRTRLVGLAWCSGHAACASAADTCDNLPAMPEGAAPWSAGAKCAKHDEYLPCRGCELEAIDAAVPEEEEQPNDKAPPSPPLPARLECKKEKVVPLAILNEVMEHCWEHLADDPRLDPVTVAACKSLRDLERGL